MVFFSTKTNRMKHLLPVAILLFAFLPLAAYAHKIKIFAAANENLITGYGYYPGGGKYRNGIVKIYGPDNLLLGQTTTDENGEFSFTATLKNDHIFIISTKDGHHAQYTVTADELPAGLADLSPQAQNKAKPATNSAPDNLHHAIGKIPNRNDVAKSIQVHPGELREILTDIVAQQINPLREQIDRYEQKIRLSDILGGIGYILGIAGLAFYFCGRKKSRE